MPKKQKDVVPFYYLRRMAEKLFGFSKDNFELLPLRVHKEETLRGYLLMVVELFFQNK